MTIRTTDSSTFKTVETTTTATKSLEPATRLYDYVEPTPIEPSRVTNYTFTELAPRVTLAPDTFTESVYTAPDQPYPIFIPETYAETAYAPPPLAPAPAFAPVLQLRPRSCPVGVGGSSGTSGSTGATGATGGVYYTGGVTSALAREITVSRGTGGLLEPTDSYSRGVIQGLQRALFAFAVRRGRGISLVADGVLNSDTVAIAISVIAEIGLPPNVSPMPRSDADIARHCRAYANHIARAAGVAIDFQPVATSTLSAAAQATASTPVVPAKLFSGRNLTIGAMLFGGLALLRRAGG